MSQLTGNYIHIQNLSKKELSALLLTYHFDLFELIASLLGIIFF
jgi:hypothetical protein